MNKKQARFKATAKPVPAEVLLTTDMLEIIYNSEPEAFEAITEFIKHVAKTYSDKYQQPKLNWLQTKGLLLGPDGKIGNLHCALKYCQRYLSEGSEKSQNPIDLLKAMHYLMFEFQRRKTNL